MEKEKKLKIYKTALSKYGEEAQLNMLYEEMGELLTAIARLKRGRANHFDVMTELADVSIMVEQMATLMSFDDFETEKDRKLNRLKEKLNGDNNK